MAQTSILSSISRTGTFPIRKTINAPNNCGTISLVLNQNWTEQMIHELPTINVAVYIDTDIKLLSIDIDMSTVTSDNIELKPVTPYSIPLFDLPTDFDFVVTPIFDEDALLSHNLQIDSGDIDVFNTSDNGIVDTNISSYINEYWTTKTDTFNLNMVFDNSNIASGGIGGGGGGGQITVDTQVMQGSTNPVQNGAIYDFVNSSVSTNTAYFIGTFNSLSDLENYSGEVSNNDYAFVVSVDLNSNTVYNRYKYNSENETWNFEYSLNNSSFTAAEWETIQSGLTAKDRTNYNNHLTNTNNPHSVTKAQVGLGNVDNTSDANKPVSTAMQTALDAKQDNLTFDGTYNASTNKAATVSTVTNAINNLDVSSVGGSGKYISAISETDGKISPIVETMDTVPTNGSKKAVTSGGVQAPLAEVVDNGAKNLLGYSLESLKSLNEGNWNNNVLTIAGVDITVNNDWSVLIDGTATTGIYFRLTSTLSQSLMAGETYILSGCENGAAGTYGIYTGTTGQWDNYSGGTGRVYQSWNSLYIFVRSGIGMDNVLFKPMICTKAAWDVSHQFEPYAKTNPELTVENASQQSEIDYAVNTGVKNLLSVNSGSGTNVTLLSQSGIIKSGKYIMSFKASNFSGNYALSFYDANSELINLGSLNGAITADKSVSFTLGQDAYTVKFFIYGTATISELMLRPAEITDPTFQPYALSNPVLTPAVIKAVDEGAKNIADFTSTTKTAYTTFTSRGVTITRNGDIFTVSGTSDTNDNIFFNIYYEGSTTTKIIPPGNWVALIEDYTGSVVKDIAIQIATPTVPPVKPYGTPVKFSLSGSETGNWLRVNVRPSTTYNGSFRLMICSQEDYAVSQKVVPYALSNPTLTPAAIKSVDEGAKNLLNPVLTDTSVYGVTATLNDGIITLNGKSTNSSGSTFRLALYPAGSVWLSGCILSGIPVNSEGVYMNLEKSGSPYTQYAHDTGNGAEIGTLPNNEIFIIFIRVPYNVQLTNFEVKPMICTLADWNVSQKYVPYCPSLPDIFKWDEYECLYTSSPTVIAKLNTSTSSVKVRINKALRRVVIYFNIVFISDFIHGTDEGFGFGTINNISNYKSFYPFSPVSTYYITEDCSAVITKNSTNALIGITCSSGQISTGTTIVGQFEYTY